MAIAIIKISKLRSRTVLLLDDEPKVKLSLFLVGRQNVLQI